MSENLSHVLLTRFNLPSKGHESLIRAREDWLRNRVRLFERYCLPSVLAQTCQDFTWLIYFDPGSPKWLLDWVSDHERQHHFTPCFREDVGNEDLLSDIEAAVEGPRGAELLTTNLDNDDGLAADFVARLQSMPRPGGRTAVYVGDGLILARHAVYRRVDVHNAFCSVREPWTAPVTCWTDWHNLLPRHMPAVVLRGDPGWLQVVHGANVSNRVHGCRDYPARYRAVFAGLMDDLPDPGPREVAREALIAAPARAIREMGRGCAKTVISAVAGKKGLDLAKGAWTSARRS